MSTNSFEKTNLGWEFQQLQRRIGEWWELQTIQVTDRLLDVPWLNWLFSPIVWTIAQVIFWVLLGLILIWLALVIIRFLEPYIKTFKPHLNQSLKGREKTELKSLNVKTWLERSQKFQQQGNYREACLCLYQAMLQELSDRAIVVNEFSRTDGEYSRLTRYLPQSNYYQTILSIHQLLCFSEVEANLDTFQQCQQAYQQIVK
jgi:hypothetical protein